MVTTEHFDATMRAVAGTLGDHTKRFDQLDECLEHENARRARAEEANRRAVLPEQREH